jgi:hypothetical protein
MPGGQFEPPRSTHYQPLATAAQKLDEADGLE